MTTPEGATGPTRAAGDTMTVPAGPAGPAHDAADTTTVAGPARAAGDTTTVRVGPAGPARDAEDMMTVAGPARVAGDTTTAPGGVRAEAGGAGGGSTTAARLRRYVIGSYPPAFYLPYAVTWALGVSALVALADPRVGVWRPDGGALVSVLTFAITLLLMRAVDDIRDLEYDRVHNPGRPLPGGAVRVRDLGVLIAAGTAAVLALNAGRGVVLALLAAQLGYTLLLLAVDRRWGWPSGDDLGLSNLVSAPVQILLNLYLYAGVLQQEGLTPSPHAVPALLTATAAFLHLEYARKVTRVPRPGERGYAVAYGPDRTAVFAVVGAVVAAGLALALTRPWQHIPGAAPWGWLVLLPLLFVAFGAYRFWRTGTPRWPLLPPALFLLTTFLAYLAAAALGKDLV
ncbi:UbiA prenyltransferase family protein [Sphaerisporangium aureirubrum]|uniref:Prenyltransferase n=1 Tax=Sphaerisporangium aureirubrum TaxID=1544736 RepID=A0ABW1NIW7_9ACTN